MLYEVITTAIAIVMGKFAGRPARHQKLVEAAFLHHHNWLSCNTLVVEFIVAD